MKNQDIEIVFITAHIRDNTTSAERFRSFAEAFISNFENVHIYEFDYPWKEKTWMGHETKNVDPLNSNIESHLRILKPQLNLFQRLIFFLFRKGYIFLAKPLHILYQIYFKRDINHPGYRTIPKDLKALNKGYVLVSGGPFGIFSYANFLANRLNYKLILDYRDPWTYGYRVVGGFKFIHLLKLRLNRNLENLLIGNAKIVTTVSETLKSYYPQAFQNKIHVISNGFNYREHDFQIEIPQTFNIVYAGTVYDDQLIDDTFFEALKLFISRLSVKRLKIQFLGSFYNEKLRKKLRDFGLDEFAEITPRLRRDQLRTYFNNSSIFIHLKYGDKSGIITSKQSDYLFFRKPILLPVSDEGDIAKSILENKAGYVCYNVEDNIKVLNDLYMKFLNQVPEYITQTEDFFIKNSRAYQAKILTDIMLASY
ncbi:glycosyltransferase family protein [Pedobacter puniceum]|uniref:Glycosyltransferase n=1 Tax=Pedobacter puniceum TaxID=2666136 RepID=A0A7K0FSQ6_9SPHI|nr:hypothetical protein [Pedobacter puniceum]MRX48671.1 hypothetical protein [Pedobacter puniceum]